jgi:hypothetical protein
MCRCRSCTGRIDVKNGSYFELRCAVLETFYEVLLSEKYTIGQAAGRCLVEFRSEAQGGGQDALVVLSVLLSRVARHEPAVLARFSAEIEALRAIGRKSACWRGLAGIEKERLQEDFRFVFEKA